MAEHTSGATEVQAQTLESYIHKDAAAEVDPISKTEVEYDGTVSIATDDDRVTPDGDEPTEKELQTLRKVADKLPWSAYLVAVVELCERFTYYGLSGPFQNYMANSYHDPNGLPGAIGLSQHGSTALSDFFQFFCYVTPILGAVISDQYLGKYWTIFHFSIIYIIGNLILFLTSLPVAIENGAALGGLVTAMIVIGLGTGGIKSNVSPLIAEQYTNTAPYLRTLKSGERVIVDPTATIQRIYMIFYATINIGSLSSIATTELEKNVGFWPAYLLPLLFFFVGFAALVIGKKKYVVKPPQGSIIPKAFKIIWIALVNKGNFNAAKPEYQEELGARRKFELSWDSVFVDEVRRALTACKVFAFYPIYWVVYSQMLNNFVTQAGTMQLHGIPNDIMQNIDPITVIIFIPICDYLVYPGLRKIGIQFKPITRITWGFFFGAFAMAYAAGVQKLIYSTGPCYDRPAACPAALQPDGTYAPNNVHVAVQTPAYLLIGLSEILASITGLEYAYTKAPSTMKSFIMSMFLLTNAGGSALAIALTPTAVDPKLTWMYVGLTIACFLAGCVFWILFSRYNKTEEEMNGLDKFTVKATPVGEDMDGEKGLRKTMSATSIAVSSSA